MKADCPKLKPKDASKSQASQKTSTPASSTPRHRMIQTEDSSDSENWKESSAPTPGDAAQNPSLPAPAASGGTETVTSQTSAPVKMSYIHPDQLKWSQMEFSHEIRINRMDLVGLRDTGSDMTSVARHLLLPGQVISHHQYRVRSCDSVPVFKDIAKVHVEYRKFVGDMHVLVHSSGTDEIIIGNDVSFRAYQIALLNKPPICLKYFENASCQTDFDSAGCFVLTRSQTAGSADSSPVLKSDSQSAATVDEEFQPIAAPAQADTFLSANTDVSLDFSDSVLFKNAVKTNASLEECRKSVDCDVRALADKRVRFYFENDLLYREYQPKNMLATSASVKQLVFPIDFRLPVLEMAHSHVLAGHFGLKKTFEKITRNFYWPKIYDSVKQFV